MKKKMLRVSLGLFLAVVCALCSQPSQLYAHKQAVSLLIGHRGIIAALRGDSVTGEEESKKKDGSLVINLTPCEGEKHLMSFQPPFEVEDAGEEACDVRTVKLIAVTQK